MREIETERQRLKEIETETKDTEKERISRCGGIKKENDQQHTNSPFYHAATTILLRYLKPSPLNLTIFSRNPFYARRVRNCGRGWRLKNIEVLDLKQNH